MGMQLPQDEGSTAATIIPSVGCPMGCNFCTTSAFFGGKGKYLNFYETGEELFDVMSRHGSASWACSSFFMMDENFLLHKRRAMELLDCMKREHESLGAVRLLVRQRHPPVHHAGAGGTGSLLGLDGPGIAALQLRQAQGRRHAARWRRELRSHGIKLLGSTIVGLEHHTPENIDEEIEHAVAHDTDFHQFMLYTPVPGTPLFARNDRAGPHAGRRRSGRYSRPGPVQFPHAAISREDSKRFLDCAFRRDFERNGPSIYRICRTTWEGWKRYTTTTPTRASAPASPGRRARCVTATSSALWAMEKHLAAATARCR